MSTITSPAAGVGTLEELDALRVAIVARQSDTDDGSMSIADQIAAGELRCEREGWQVVAVYTEEDTSGGRPLAKRKGLLRAVEGVESGAVDIIMIGYFDRLARSLKTQTEVLERVEQAPFPGRVMSLDIGEISTKTAAAWLSATQLGAVAEYYRRTCAERTAASKAKNVEKGVPPFPQITPAYERIPSGEDKGKLRPHPVNAPLVREAARMRIEGASLAFVAAFLRENGIHITVTGLRSMFASRLLRGEIHFGKYGVNLHAHEAVLDEATFRKLKATRATRGRRPKVSHLLSRLGVLRCASCGSRMSVRSGTGGGRGHRTYSYYRCTNELCEARASISCAEADAVVRDEALRLCAELEGRAGYGDELELAARERAEAERRFDATVRKLAGLEGEDVSREVIETVQAERDAAVAKHERLLRFATPGYTVRTAADWSRLEVGEQRALIAAVIERALVVRGDGPGRVSVEGCI